MPIHGQCPGCGRKFQAPESLAGKRVKCPKCSAAIDLPGDGPKPAAWQETPATVGVAPPPPTPKPGMEEPRWLVKLGDGRQLGPMDRADLDTLVDRRRLDGSCQLRREDWSDWQWAETVYAQLIVPVEPDAPAEVPPVATGRPVGEDDTSSRLRPCPDCGQMASRRASQCPHCGGPLAGSARPLAGSGPLTGVEPDRGNRRWGVGLLVAGLVGGVVLAGVVIVAIVWWFAGSLMNTHQAELQSVLDELTVPEPAPPTPVAPPSPTEQPATPEQIAQWKEAAAADAARRVDDLARQVYLARSQFEAFQQNANLLRSIIDDPMGQPGDQLTPAAEAAPYASKYESLHAECLAHLRDSLPAEGIDQAEIQDAATGWLEEKCRPLEEELRQKLQGQLGL